MIYNESLDTSIDIMKYLFWEYDKSNVRDLLEYLQAEIEKTNNQFWRDWMVNVFTLETCNEFGVSVWAIILDLPILLEVDPAADKFAFGFGEFRANYAPDSNFGGIVGGSALLTTDQKRRILRMRYRMLTGTGNPIEFNSYSNILTEGLGIMYMRNNGDMTIDYVTDFVSEAWIDYAYATFDIFPTPSGVKAGAAIVVEL